MKKKWTKDEIDTVKLIINLVVLVVGSLVMLTFTAFFALDTTGIITYNHLWDGYGIACVFLMVMSMFRAESIDNTEELIEQKEKVYQLEKELAKYKSAETHETTDEK